LPFQLLSFDEALGLVSAGKTPNILLGNGFSRACLDQTFAYDALKSRADFSGLSEEAWQVFDVLGTSDFELVMRALSNAAKLTALYEGPESETAQRLATDAVGLKEVLVQAIAQSHPDHPFEIPDERYGACKHFLAHFDTIYTLNYDLLLYWALMRSDIDPAVRCDDGFRTPEEEGATYVVWEPDSVKNQNIYYLHGALHLFDSPTELQKFTWIRTGVRLIDQIRQSMANDLLPLFVSEGSSQQKLTKIRHDGYLSRAERSLYVLGKPLFVYGHSMATNDEHILRAIRRSNVRELFVSLHGDPESESNRFIRSRAQGLADQRPPRRSLEVAYFSAESANVWG
jgi:hypothetical protein